MKDFMLRRLSETSTWAGLFLVASAWGLEFTAQQQAALTVLGMALAGAPDKQHKQFIERRDIQETVMELILQDVVKLVIDVLKFLDVTNVLI